MSICIINMFIERSASCMLTLDNIKSVYRIYMSKQNPGESLLFVCCHCWHCVIVLPCVCVPQNGRGKVFCTTANLVYFPLIACPRSYVCFKIKCALSLYWHLKSDRYNNRKKMGGALWKGDLMHVRKVSTLISLCSLHKIIMYDTFCFNDIFRF